LRQAALGLSKQKVTHIKPTASTTILFQGDREMETHKQSAKNQKQKQTFACVMSLDLDKKTDFK
jgi:hypothetical protein